MGELFSLAAAVIWALAVILLKRSTERAHPFALNLFRVAFSLPLFLGTLLVLREPLWGVAPARDIGVLVLSGWLGIALSDTLFHMGLSRVGAGITAIVDGLYSPLVALFAFGLLGERLGPWQWLGMAMVIAAILVASRHEPPPGATRRRLLAGIGYGSLAMVCLALAIVIAKPVLERTPVIWATAVRQAGCAVLMLPLALLSPRRRDLLGVFRPAPRWRTMLGATVLGSYLSLIFWIAGMKYTLAGSAAIINQTSSIFVLVFATLLLREAFTRRKAIAGVLALGGICLVILG